MFPVFSPLTSAQGQAYFNSACLICANSCSNPIFGDGNLETLLLYLTSHFAMLLCPKDSNGNPAATGQAPSPLVGRISSAQQGSVNVQTEWPMDGNATHRPLCRSADDCGKRCLSWHRIGLPALAELRRIEWTWTDSRRNFSVSRSGSSR
jgi:hypothetical protein